MPTLTSLKYGQGRRLYVSATKEATFATAATITHIIEHPLESSRLEITTERISDKGYASGNTQDHEQAHLPASYGMTGNISCWATTEALGIFLAKCMAGGDTKGGAGPYTHAIAYAAAPTFLDGMTIEEHLNGATADTDVDTCHLGVCVDSVELSFGLTGFATLNVGLVGSGRTQAATDKTESGLTKPSYFLAAPKIRVGIEAAASEHTSPWDGSHEVSATAGTFATIDASATDISHLLESFTIRISNGAQLQYLAGSSTTAAIYASQAFTGDRTVEVEFTAMHDATTEPLIRSLVNSTTALQKEYAFYIDIAGGTNGYGAQIVVPLAAMVENPGGGTGGGVAKYSFRFLGRKTSAGTDRSVVSAYIANQDNYDYL